jgi:hypothetical protein
MTNQYTLFPGQVIVIHVSKIRAHGHQVFAESTGRLFVSNVKGDLSLILVKRKWLPALLTFIIITYYCIA